MASRRIPVEVGRRDVLRVGGATLTGGMALAGCDLLATDPDDDGGADDAGGDDAREAPMLSDRISSGDVPPLEERLPTTPVTVEPYDEAGRYGGTLNLIVVGAGPAAEDALNRTVGYERILRWTREPEDWTADDVLPDVAESYTVNDDATEYVFTLRPGMKWSDGEPFTAGDIVFWYEAVLSNEDVTPTIPTWLQAEGVPVVVEKIDDHTVAFRFEQPNSLLWGNLAHGLATEPTRHPRHYLEQFHIDYNDDVRRQAEDEEFNSWADLYLQRSSPWENAELPVLHAWQLTEALGEVTGEVRAVRNPYYWKVDTDGRQLPYIDEVTIELASDSEVAKLQTLNAQVDFVYSHQAAGLYLPDKPVFADAREEADFEFLDLIREDSNTMALSLNLTHRDPAMREIFRNIDFRIGLSHAMNRAEMIEVVYQGQGEPAQVAPHPGTAYYSEELATQYTEYDVDLANQYLDRVLPDKNADGARLGPDGRPFGFDVESDLTDRPQDVDAVEMMRDYFAEVGIRIRAKPEGGTLFLERREGNLHDAAVFGSGGGLHPIFQPDFYLPVAGSTSMYAVAWSAWYDAGGVYGSVDPEAEGLAEEPAPAAIRQMELYEQLKNTIDADEQIALMNEVLEIAREEFWCIGLSRPEGMYGIIKNRLRNVQNPMIDDYPWQTPGPTNVQQYFIRE